MAACRDNNRIVRFMTFFRFVLAAMLMSAWPAHGADRTIYLTFDDGPLNGTSNILDVLAAEQVRRFGLHNDQVLRVVACR